MHLRKITNYEKLKNKTKRLWNWSLVIERSQIFAENFLGGGGGGGGGVGEAWGGGARFLQYYLGLGLV